MCTGMMGSCVLVPKKMALRVSGLEFPAEDEVNVNSRGLLRHTVIRG